MRCLGCGSMLVWRHPQPRPRLLLWRGRKLQMDLLLQLVMLLQAKCTPAWWQQSCSRTTDRCGALLARLLCG
jgi:hypothetical protein